MKNGKVTKERALLYHSSLPKGKVSVTPTKPLNTQDDLSLAYSPGVAFPCLEIQEDPQKIYDYTSRGNLVGIITNSTAVLGLGDIGQLAGKPVMEGKAVLFKKFSDIDAFDIEVKHKDVDKFCDAVEAFGETFGGINLEDIKAPECFMIEERLKKNLNIPVFHDDQHGTAIVATAALMNAIEITSRSIQDAKIVVNGAGAAAHACINMFKSIGAKDITVLDSKGVINESRTDLNEFKKQFVRNTSANTLEEAMVDCDIFLGVSSANLIGETILKGMAKKPIILALANPDPEVLPDIVRVYRPESIVATGRSDYHNQVNNVLGFPFIFRGALDSRATTINDEMKIAAAKAIADIAKMPFPSYIKDIYGEEFSFGRHYILPKPFDRRLLVEVPYAVAKAGVETGVAKSDFDLLAYKEHLQRLAQI